MIKGRNIKKTSDELNKINSKWSISDTKYEDFNKSNRYKKVKKTEEKPKKVKQEEVDVKKLREDLDILGGWVADIDDDFNEMQKMITRLANRLGLE